MFNWEVFYHFLLDDPQLYFLQAAWMTLWISVVAQFIGVVLGLLLALMSMSETEILRWPARIYIWFFRGSPLLVQVLLLWAALPKLSGILLPGWACVLIAFSLNEGAYMSEITRAAIDSVDKGQMEAAKALGMRYQVAMRRIILPQAARVIVPPLGNEFNNMLKSTSIASVIGVMELTQSARVLGAGNFTTFELLIVATIYYLLLTTIWEIIQRFIEHRLNYDRVRPDPSQTKSLGKRILGFGH